MTQSLIVIAISVISFIATSLENLLLLIAILSNSRQSKSSVTLGYIMATVIIVVLARIISDISELIPSQFLGLLGLIPIGLGVWELLQGLRHQFLISVSDSPLPWQSRSSLSISAIMIANGGDSLAVFAALFADTQWYLKWLIVVSALVMTGIWVSLAAWIAKLDFFSESWQRFTQILMPFLLIGIGVYILLNSPTDIIQ